MSETNTSALPDPNEAYDHLFREVRANVFFNKLASYGRQPANEADAASLLETAAKLRTISESQPVKQAEASGKYAQASSALDRLMGANGLDGQYKQAAAQEEELSFQNYARQLAQDPSVYNSVLAVKQAQADAVVEQLS